MFFISTGGVLIAQDTMNDAGNGGGDSCFNGRQVTRSGLLVCVWRGSACMR